MIKRESMMSALNWRYAVKQFDKDKKVSDADFADLLEVLRLSPSSYGLQPWRFIVVRDRAVLEQLRPVSWNQSQVVDASHCVVFAGLKDVTKEDILKHIQNTANTRGIDPEALGGYRDLMINNLVGKKGLEWTSRQLYIALGNVMNAAAFMGIDTCAMEGIDPDKYDEILGLKGTRYAAVCACAIGYRSEQDQYSRAKKVRFSTEEVVFYK